MTASRILKAVSKSAPCEFSPTESCEQLTQICKTKVKLFIKIAETEWKTQIFGTINEVSAN